MGCAWQPTLRRSAIIFPITPGKVRKPVYGQRIRPLERRYKDKTLTKSPPDRIGTRTEAGAEMRAEIWEDLVLPDATPDPQEKTFNVYAIYDPAYTTPWLLAVPFKLQAATVKAICQDPLACGANPTRRQANGEGTSPVCTCG